MMGVRFSPDGAMLVSRYTAVVAQSIRIVAFAFCLVDSSIVLPNPSITRRFDKVSIKQ